MNILISVPYYCFRSTNILFSNRYKSGYDLSHIFILPHCFDQLEFLCHPILLDLPLYFPLLFCQNETAEQILSQNFSVLAGSWPFSGLVYTFPCHSAPVKVQSCNNSMKQNQSQGLSGIGIPSFICLPCQHPCTVHAINTELPRKLFWIERYFQKLAGSFPHLMNNSSKLLESSETCCSVLFTSFTLCPP